MKCPACGLMMKPLFTGFYCPGDCDRKKPSTVDEEWDLPTKEICPGCHSSNTALLGFLTAFSPSGMHCWDCGKCW